MNIRRRLVQTDDSFKAKKDVDQVQRIKSIEIYRSLKYLFVVKKEKCRESFTVKLLKTRRIRNIIDFIFEIYIH